MKTCEKILIVDDDKWMTDLVKGALERDGVARSVVAVNDSREAVATVASYRPDLIILDMAMPHMDGEAVACELQDSPLFSGIPILFLTSLVQRRPQLRYGVAHANVAILAKPATRGELKSVIAICLGVVSGPGEACTA